MGTSRQHDDQVSVQHTIGQMGKGPTFNQARCGLPFIDRYATAIRWMSLLAMLVGLMLFIWALDLARLVSAMQGLISGLGFRGMVLFTGIYVLVTISFLPGSVFTLAAGAMFGPLWGTITVSIGSTIGAAIAFLIARYAARQSVVRLVQRRRRLAALDRAIARGGWRVVALLRISPAIPFNIQNYALGVTPIGFWAYLISSWLAMLPGTFFYVYLGFLGYESLKAATGQHQSIETIHWIILGSGLIVTVVVTIYLTYLAGRAIKRDAGDKEVRRLLWRPKGEEPTGGRSRWLTYLGVILAVVLLAGGIWAKLNALTVNEFFSSFIACGIAAPRVGV